MKPGETLFLHPRSINRPPNGIRTRVPAVKERCPRPLDDGGVLVPAERRRVELLRPVKGSLFSKQVPPPSLGWPFPGGAGWCVPRERLELSRPSRAPVFGTGASAVPPPRRVRPGRAGSVGGGRRTRFPTGHPVAPPSKRSRRACPVHPPRSLARCTSPGQLRVQESNLGGLESESRWDAGNPTRIVFTRRWPESNRHSPKAPLCRRLAGRSPTASWIPASPGSESNRRPPLYERGALYQLSYQGENAVLDRFFCEPHPGIEPGISSLPRRCFTTEPAGQCTTTWPPGDSNPDITVFTRALSPLS